MGDTNGEKWIDALPWTLLARRTAYHADLGATPSEMVMGDNPRLPGDISPEVASDKSIPELLERLRQNANSPPAQTNLRKTISTYFPPAAQHATHAYTKNHKTSPLSPLFSGPFPIVERVGKSCITLQTGHFASGQPRLETHHWYNCHPVTPPAGTSPAVRPKLGRPAHS